MRSRRGRRRRDVAAAVAATLGIAVLVLAGPVAQAGGSVPGAGAGRAVTAGREGPAESATGAAELDLEMRPLHGPRGDVAALILAGTDGGALRVAASAFAGCEAGAEGASEVVVWVEAEARSLLAAARSAESGGAAESVRLELYVYAMTRDGGIGASVAEWVRIGVDALEALGGGGVKLPARLALPAGSYQLRVLLREPRSQRFALRVVGVEAGSPAAAAAEIAAPVLAAPAFRDDGGGWLRARPSGAAGDWEPEALTAALPVLVMGGDRELGLRGCRLDGARLAGRVTTLDGREIDGAEIVFETRAPTGARSQTGVVARLSIAGDAGVEPGLHRLELTAELPGGTAETSQPVVVVPPAARDGHEPPLWTSLGEGSDRPPTPAGASDGRDEIADGETAAVVRGYRHALGWLAQGRRDEAVAALADLQTDVAGDLERPRRAVQRLDGAMNRVTRQLLERDAETLLPVVLLHLDLERRYRESEDANPFLLEATRTRVAALAQVYAEESRSEMSRHLAALSLVELAAALGSAQQRMSALGTLRDALSLDPTNPEVLLDLAVQFESHGFDGDARVLLDRLLELEPRSQEGRLRLALNLSRAQRRDEAADLLRRLVRDGDEEWVLAVAYGELARLLILEQRFDEAARLLGEGGGRLPGVQRLQVLRAYVLERVGERAAARRVVASLAPAAAGPSPRLRYRVPQVGEDRASRRVLVRHATARLPLLTQALAATEDAP